MIQHTPCISKNNVVKPRVYFLSLLLVIVLLLTGFAACKKQKPTDEELIEGRITTFVTAYNDGDMDTVLTCLDTKSRNTFQAILNLFGGLASTATGFNIDLSDLFSLGVSTTSGDFMELKIFDIDIIDEGSALATTTMELAEEGKQTIYFVMIYEKDGWYIADMTDYNSFDSNDSSSNNNKESNNDEENNSQSIAKTEIDPFMGIEYVVTGISPYCEITINNQNCEVNAQKYITYSLNSETYANGETAVITATIEASAQNEYSLSQTIQEYIVQGQPEYITSINNLDLSLLESELQDYIDSQCSSALGSKFAFGKNLYGWSFDSRVVAEIQASLQETYFSSLKLMRIDLMDSSTPFNKLSFVYKINVTADDNSTVTLYVNVSALNIVKYADGNIKWGSTSTESYDFTRVTFTSSLEECVSNTITANKTNYNISKID